MISDSFHFVLNIGEESALPNKHPFKSNVTSSVLPAVSASYFQSADNIANAKGHCPGADLR